MNITVIRFSSLGDVILTTPVLKALKAQFPQSRIIMVTKDIYADVFRFNPNINELILLDEKGIFGLIKKIKHYKTDILVDLHCNLRSRIVRFLVRPRKTLKYKKDNLKRRMLVVSSWIKGIILRINAGNNIESFVKIPSELRSIRHVTEKYLDAVKPVLSGSYSISPEMHFRGKDEDIMSYFGLKNEKKYIGFNPGGKWETKRWGAEKFVELGKLLKEKYSFDLIVFGDERDFELSRRISSELGAVNLAGKTSISELAKITSFCNVLVTGDSGVMHIASALGVPIVAIFGSTVVDFGFYPLGRECYIVYSDLPCRPCALHGRKKCPIKTRVCMDSISVSLAAECIHEILKAD